MSWAVAGGSSLSLAAAGRPPGEVSSWAAVLRQANQRHLGRQQADQLHLGLRQEEEEEGHVHGRQKEEEKSHLNLGWKQEGHLHLGGQEAEEENHLHLRRQKQEEDKGLSSSSATTAWPLLSWALREGPFLSWAAAGGSIFALDFSRSPLSSATAGGPASPWAAAGGPALSCVSSAVAEGNGKATRESNLLKLICLCVWFQKYI